MSYTKEKQKEYNARYYQKRKKKIIDFLGGRCAECGSIDNLEVDHVDWRKKSFDVLREWSTKRTWDIIQKELEKCQLLCSEHHQIKTKQDQSEQKTKEPNHGTIYAWMKRKCTCEICSIAKRRWYDARNKKRRLNGSGPRQLYGRPACHGEKLRYSRGCRCSLCRKANADYAKKLRNK